jgi:hypothetical protein
MMTKIAQHACVWLFPLERDAESECPFSARIPPWQSTSKMPAVSLTNEKPCGLGFC